MANRRSIPTNLREQVAPTPLHEIQYRVGSGLNPAVASAIIYSADLGYMDRLADVSDEILEIDGHLQSVYSKRGSHVATAPWEIRFLDESKASQRRTKKDVIVEACTEALNNLSVPLLLNDLQSCIYHGAAVVELTYVRDGKYLMPEEFELIHARRYRYSQTNWQACLYDADPTSPFGRGEGFPIKELQRILPGKFLYDRGRIRPGYPQRDGLARTSLWYSGVFKRLGYRDLLALIEQYGRPIRWGKYNTGRAPGTAKATPQDVDTLEAKLLALSSNLVGVFPDTADPQFVQPPSSNGELHETLRNACDGEVSKAYVGGNLTTDSGKKGARSLGDTQREDQLLIGKLDALKRAHTIRKDFLKPFVRRNFGENAPVPHFFLMTDPNEDLNLLANRYKTLASFVSIPDSHVRDVFALPDVKEGEKATQIPVSNPGKTPPEDTEEDADKDKEKQDKKDADAD